MPPITVPSQKPGRRPIRAISSAAGIVAAILSGAGWIMVQIAVVPFVVVAGVAVLWWRHRDASGTAMLRPAEPV